MPTVEITKELEQALAAVCDLALKHAGLQASSAVNTIVTAFNKAASDAPFTPSTTENS